MAINRTYDEAKVIDHIHNAYRGILDLHGGLLVNHNELAEAVHVLQHFVAQAVLHRECPSEWSAWYHDQMSQEEREQCLLGESTTTFIHV